MELYQIAQMHLGDEVKIMADQRVRYVIDIDKRVSIPVEVALTEFMSGVFDLAEKSKCIGNGLEIRRVEITEPNPLDYRRGCIVEHKNGTIGTIVEPRIGNMSTTMVILETEEGRIWHHVPIEMLTVIGR